MTLKIEEGKFYRTRDGRKVGPVRTFYGSSTRYAFDVDSGDYEFGGTLWSEHGASDEGSEEDLVAEWVDEPASGVSGLTADDVMAEDTLSEEQREAEHYDPVRVLKDWLSAAGWDRGRGWKDGDPPIIRRVKEAVRRAEQAPAAQQKAEPGWKMDAGKPRIDLVAPEFIQQTADVLAFGAAKYSERNWERGMSWGRCFGALMRHMWAWWAGERNDPESGLPHLAHAACCLMFLVAYEARSVGTDDRKLTLDKSE